MDFWMNLFDTSDFPSRWHCGNWSDAHGWLHILSDLGVWSAYFAIPCVLLYFILRRKDLPFRKVVFLFVAFILLCGTTHLMEAIIFYWPAYRLAGVIKFLTAAVSWVTVVALVYVAPKALAMRSPEELEKEIAARRKAEQQLQRLNQELEQRVEKRTAELSSANRTLYAQREWFSTTLASIGDAVITTDEKGRVTTLNPVAESLTGWTSAEALGHPLTVVFNVVHEETREPVENPAIRALEQGVVVGLANHSVLIAKDGGERPIDDSAAPIRLKDRDIAGCVLVFRDVAKRRQAERQLQEREERYRALVTASAQVVWTTDPQGEVTEDSPSWREFTGQTYEQWRGSGWLGAIHESDREPTEELWRNCVAAKSIYQTEYRLKAADGAYRWTAVRAVPVLRADGTIREWVGTNTDITDKRRLEAERQRQLNLTKTITDNATTAIFLIDNENRCTFMNPAAEEITGFTFQEVEGQILHDLIHHTRPDGTPFPTLECPIDRALPEGFEVHNHEDRFVRKSGEFFPVLCNACPIAEDGEASGTVIEMLDLTEQNSIAQRLHESEARFTQLADVIPQLAWMAGPDGHVEWYNSRWCEYTGTTYEQMETRGWSSVHDPDVLPQVMERWQQSLATGEPFDMVFPLKGADGEFRPFLTRIMPFRDETGAIVRWFGTSTDISEQRRIQDELRAVAARLSDADRRKDTFLATLAHELRNPLAPISTGLEVMKMADDPEQLAEVRSMMERQTRQLVILVNDLLDVSRITRGKLQLRRCDVQLKDVVQSAVEAARPFIDEANHELTLTVPEEPIHLNADPNRLAQIFSNLLNNAAKYTPDGGHIRLTAEREAGEVAVSVKDSGIGIPDTRLDEIFEMFGQIEHPLQRTTSGLGIGLTLVKSLVEMHGGKIDVHSEGEGRGSEFVVRLPVARENPAKEISRPNSSSDADAVRANCRVMIVDDNQAAATTLGMAVKMLGYEVRMANDGKEAVDLAAEFLPDVVLMDIGMPKMNGYEAARHIRRQPWGERMLLVALTGWGQDEDKLRSKEAGFDHHLVKPAEPADLRRLLSNSQKS